MRPLVLLIGSILIAGAQAQSMLEHGAATAGAAMGAAAGKPVSDAITKIFGKTEEDTAKAAKTPVKTAPAAVKATAKKPALPEAPEASQPAPRSRSQHAPTAAFNRLPTITLSQIAEPVAQVREPSVEELTSIKEGASEKEMIAVLGQPGSRVTVPDDDGHLRETCQYWSKGQQIGTIRLDNGQVVTVQARN